jgi:hypothetical protein
MMSLSAKERTTIRYAVFLFKEKDEEKRENTELAVDTFHFFQQKKRSPWSNIEY